MSYQKRIVLPFWDWIMKKYRLDAYGFMKLNAKEVKKIFYLWKHGLSNEESIDNIEHGERAVMAMLAPEYLAKCDPETKAYWEEKIRFCQICNKYAQELGLPTTYIRALDTRHEYQEEPEKIVSLDEAERMMKQ